MWILLYNGSRRSQCYGPKEASPKPTAGSDFSPSTPPRKNKEKKSRERQTDIGGETFNAHFTSGQPYQNNSIIPSSLGPQSDISSRGTWDADHSRSSLPLIWLDFPIKKTHSFSPCLSDPWVPVKNPSKRSRKRGARPWQPCLRLQREGRLWMKSSFIQVNAGKFASPHPAPVSFGKSSETQR